jgi:hemolysin activation/secretion protein
VAWLGQAQYVRRLFGTQNQLILRTDAQWSDGELPSLEQFALGGMTTVRGYRENQIVRDRGLLGSIELRLPVLLNKLGAPVVQLAPFFDAGTGKSLGVRGTDSILSAGIGLLLNPCRNANAVLYWGYAFKDFKTPENDPQDLGLHFRVTFEAF